MKVKNHLAVEHVGKHLGGKSILLNMNVSTQVKNYSAVELVVKDLNQK
jgi:hypothetical protein